VASGECPTRLSTHHSIEGGVVKTPPQADCASDPMLIREPPPLFCYADSSHHSLRLL
jgi:hypothetical protein